MKQFSQGVFTPNRTDLDVEPLISRFRASVIRGTVGLCTSNAVADSVMSYQTTERTVNIRGGKLVIEANEQETKISMIEGENTVGAGSTDMGGHTIHAGEQAIIRRRPGQSKQLQIARIQPAEMSGLEDRVAMACVAKRTVYFEQQDRAPTASEKAAWGDGSDPGPGGSITAFNGASATSSRKIHELVPFEVLPLKLPTECTISPAIIYSANRPGT